MPSNSRPAALTAWACVTVPVEFSVVLPEVFRPTVFTVSMAKLALLVRLTVLVSPASFLMSLLVLVSVCVALAPSSSRPAALMAAVCEMALVAPAPLRVRFLVAEASPTVNAAPKAMLPPVCKVILPVCAKVVVAPATVILPDLLASPITRLPALIWFNSA